MRIIEKIIKNSLYYCWFPCSKRVGKWKFYTVEWEVFLLLEVEKVKEKIAQLDESEAKSLLMIIYGRLDIAINGTGGDEFIKKTIIDLFDI